MYVLARRSKDFGLFTSPLTKMEGMTSTEGAFHDDEVCILALDASSKLIVCGANSC
jgi:hypothetical protein